MSEIRHSLAGRVTKFLPGDGSRSCSGELSNETQDLALDILVASGCNLTNFRNNSICLYNHDPDQPIGRWIGVAVQDKRIAGTMNFPPPGASARADEICNLVKDGVISGISVGFVPQKYEPIKGGGLKFRSWTLLEASLVAIPANPSALVTQRRLPHASSRGQRIAEAALIAAEVRLMEAGFTSIEAEYYARKHTPRGNCGRSGYSECGLVDRHDCAVHRNV